MRYSITFKDLIKLPQEIRCFWFYINEKTRIKSIQKIDEEIIPQSIADVENGSDFDDADELV